MRAASLVGILLAAACAGGCGRQTIRFPEGKRTGGRCRWGAHQRIVDRKNPEVLASRFFRRSAYDALEKARLRGGIRLEIHHKGCTRYALVFDFRLPAGERSLADAGYWYSRAATLLETLAWPQDDPKGLKKIAERLREAGRSGDIPYGEPVETGAWQTARVDVSEGPPGKGPRVLIQYEFKR